MHVRIFWRLLMPFASLGHFDLQIRFVVAFERHPLPSLSMLRILLVLMLLRPCYLFLVVDAAVIPTATASALRTIPGRNNRFTGLAAYLNAAATNFLSAFALHPLGCEQSLSCDLQAQSSASSHLAVKSTPGALADCLFP